MTIDLARFLGILAAIATCLVAAIKYLVSWIRELVEQQRLALEKENAELRSALKAEHEQHLLDAKKYAQSLIDQSKAHIEAIRAVDRWTRR